MPFRNDGAIFVDGTCFCDSSKAKRGESFCQRQQSMTEVLGTDSQKIHTLGVSFFLFYGRRILQKSHRVEHLQNFVLLTRVQAVDDHRQPGLVLSERVDGLGHLGHQLHFALQNLKDTPAL